MLIRGSLLSLVGLVFCNIPANAQQNIFVVNSTTDLVDAAPGDGICASALGHCTLRAAVQEANATIEDDTISLPAGRYRLRIPGADEDFAETGDLDIRQGSIDIIGAGAAETIVDARRLDRVFHLVSGRRLLVSGVTITGGSANRGGGILGFHGSIVLREAVVRDNVAQEGNGGGINALENSLFVTDSEITHNVAYSGVGGGISHADRPLNIIRTLISRNAAARGGGVFITHIGGSFNLQESTISFNFAAADGGGLYVLGAGTTISRTTVSNNEASGCGGGIAIYTGMRLIVNTTVSGNRANGSGGGICVLLGGVPLRSTSVVANVADADLDGFGDGGGVFLEAGTGGSLGGTLMAQNVGAMGLDSDCGGRPLSSLGYNLIWHVEGCVLTGDITGNIIGLDPAIGPLRQNGGLTNTHALRQHSPAIDALPLPACLDASGGPILTDQRGVPRPQRAACDIGAFELEGHD